MAKPSSVETTLSIPAISSETIPVTVETESRPTKLSKDERKELAMAKAGVTDCLMMEAMYRGLTAKKVTRELKDGKWEERVEDDLVIQHKFLDSALRTAGFIKTETNVDNSVNFNLTVKQREEIRGRLSKVFGGRI